ncbi:MAG: hypothetical protein AB8B91_13280 [Rubripirellula sp.]
MNQQPQFNPQCVSSTTRGELYGYALWKFSEQGWELAKDCTVEGAINSGPPTIAGLFPGQIRATPSVAA